MHALEDFTLELERCSELFDPGDLQPYERTELPSVRRLRIETEYVHERGEISALLKCALFSSLFFPGAVDLHVGLKGIMSEILALQGLHLDAEVAYIFRHVEQFPRVERFHLEVFGRSAGRLNVTSSLFGVSEDTITLNIPLIMLPSLRNISLYSNAQLSINAIHIEGPSTIGEHAFIHPRVFGAKLPALETIAINIPKEGAIWVASWMWNLLKEQNGRGEWEVFRELVLEHNDVADDHVERKNRYVGFPAFVAWYRSQLMAHRGE